MRILLWFSESDKEEVDQFKYLGSIQTISKRSRDPTGATTLSHDKAGNAVGKQSHQFAHEDYTLQVTVLSCRCPSMDVRAGL